MSNSAFGNRTLKRKNVKGLALSAPQPRSPTPSEGDVQIPGGLGNDISRPDTLEIGENLKLDLKSEDLIVLKELGAGNGGTVSKVMHPATKAIMAKKVRYHPAHRSTIALTRFPGYPCRGQKRGQEADCARAASHVQV